MRKFDKDKYLKKLKFQKYKRYIYLGIPCLVLIVIGIYFTYSKFSVLKDTEVVRTTVGEFIQGDIVLTPYIDGEYSKEFPKDEVGINVEKVTCDNDAVGEWDEDNWRLKVTNLTKRTKCNVYFVTPKSCGINDNVSCINSREGLANLATEVNNGDDKSGKIYYLTSDIDLGGKFDSNGNALDGNTSWTPIGIGESQFQGVFDGNGHIINNLYINSSGLVSLFNYTNDAVIKNLGIENSYLKSSDGMAGAIAGESHTTRIVNCYSKAIVIGKDCVSGIVARFNGAVKNCYNAGNISASGQFAGGIVGYLNGSSSMAAVYNSYNYGVISANREAAGIAGGSQAKIGNTYNLGNINGATSGGIAGQYYTPSSPQVYNSYNSGKITTGGGILGEVYTGYDSNLIRNNYFLEGTATYGLYNVSSNTGTETLSKDKMPSVISVINEDNAFVEDTNNINNGYPILKWQQERNN